MRLTDKRYTNWEILVFFIYTFCYFFYLTLYQESELFHWISLVTIPLIIIVVFFYLRDKKLLISTVFESVGISKKNLHRKIVIAIMIGAVFCVLQLFMSQNKEKIIQILQSIKVLYALPITFLLIFFTAGFTEEFFFRGVLQTRIQSLFKSRLAAIIIVSLLFSIYHVPYAYFSPHWPSYGNINNALALSFSQALPIGIICGFLYAYSGNNLLACVILHTLIDLFPAMASIKGI